MKPLMLGYDAREKPVLLDSDGAKTHTHVIGASGGGKSKYLENIMRQFLKNQQGFALLDPHGTLYEDVLAYCAHYGLDREVILLNVSKPGGGIVGFNPFQRAPSGDVSVQVDRRISATVHAWNEADTDQRPTLARDLRLFYTILIELNIPLPQLQHLIDFSAREIRGSMIERLASGLVQKEWRELQMLKPKEWRDETLSVRNRLFKFLTSEAICRFMGLPDRSINLQQIMDEGKVLLINLAQSDHLSNDNARAFGALLVNEIFETALRRSRDGLGRPPRPFHVVLDEFQTFVSLDIANALDQLRKYSVFFLLSHQRFGQLDENITDAVLTNCRIKAVFGGLPAASARLMAEELFIGELDPKKIKVAIYQTKFWPEYRRDKVYTRGTGRSSASGSSQSSSSGSFGGASSATSFFQPNDWFLGMQQSGITQGESSGWSDMESSSSSNSESWSDSESVADVPILIPVPFEELSSVQYYSTEEQLTELTAALKEQFPRHCFIKIQDQKTQPLLVPFIAGIDSFRTSRENLDWYCRWQLERQHALPAAEVDRLLARQETALIHALGADMPPGAAASECADGDGQPQGATVAAQTPGAPGEDSIWPRRASAATLTGSRDRTGAANRRKAKGQVSQSATGSQD